MGPRPEAGRGEGVGRPRPNLSFTSFTCLTSNKPCTSPLLHRGVDVSGTLRHRPDGQEEDGPVRAAGNPELGLLSRAEYPLGSLLLALCDLGPAPPVPETQLAQWPWKGRSYIHSGDGGSPRLHVRSPGGPSSISGRWGQASRILRKPCVGGARCSEGTSASLWGFGEGTGCA